MRRPVHRILFGAAIGASGIILAALALATAIEVAHAQTRPGRGGGGGGVSLQPTSPGISQGGSIHVGGNIIADGNFYTSSGTIALPSTTTFSTINLLAHHNAVITDTSAASVGQGGAGNLSSGQEVFISRNNGTSVFRVMGDGSLFAGLAGTTPVLTAVTSAQVTNNGTTATVARQTGTAITSATRTGAGQVTIALSGMTTLGIVNCTAFVSSGAPPSTATSCSATPVTNQVLVAVFNGANALSDTGFMLTVQTL